MKGRVLMVGTALDGQGGVASVLRTWRDYGLFDRWDVRFVATNGPGSNLDKLLLALRAWLCCAWLIAFGDVELVHVHTSSYVSFWRKTPVFALALLWHRRLIVSLHGGAFREFYAGRGRLGKAWIRLVMRRALRFVVLTQEWECWARSTVPTVRVCVIPNPAPFLPQTPVEAPWQDPPLLLFLGRVERNKGAFVLLEALARSRSAGACWRLICGGNGDLAAARRAADAVGLGPDDVQFLGWIDGDLKRCWLERCTLLVLPSFIENLPVVILEAFSYGRPVIATRVGGVPDVVTAEVDGFLIEPGDVEALAEALERAFVVRERLGQMGLNGRAKVQARFAPRHVIAQVEAMYKECLEVPSQTEADATG